MKEKMHPILQSSTIVLVWVKIGAGGVDWSKGK
jgi:hypothetical protein